MSAVRRPAATFPSRPGDHDGATWHHLDLRDPLSLDEALDTVAPAVVINTTSGRADWAVTGLDIRLDSRTTRKKLRIRFRGALEFLSKQPRVDPADVVAQPAGLAPQALPPLWHAA
ncbi:hypothetical protein HZZ00_12545 [Streptomyces sp. NEAU-sy36]|uniref:hypothetical protein n=1 Tax=unclassified Streptomyces TaxID=2593676 RepID=UPI0015D5EFD2|nr:MULTISPECIES: hypothetical protein [unclassified Streptomyces]QLJ01774.1 hypothetical protein HZZ00_12545 [Streptomyces sp. NEAU-sy36]